MKLAVNMRIRVLVLFAVSTAVLAPAATTVTNIIALSTNAGAYHTWSGSGVSTEFSSPPCDPDRAVQDAGAMISDNPAEGTGIGFVSAAPTALAYMNSPYRYQASITRAAQTITVDLTTNTPANNYVSAWLDWPCHFSPGTGGNQFDQVRYGPVVSEKRTLAPGALQSVAFSFVPYFFSPTTHYDTGYGGWACDTPAVYVVRQVADVQPKQVNNPGCQKLSNVGDPMNVINGDMSLAETDLVIPAPGIPLEFRRWYGSVGANTGALGPKWICPADFSIRTTNTTFDGVSNQWLVVRLGENDEWSALSVTNGAVAVSHGLRWTGSVNTNGTYSVNLPAGLTCQFGTNGLLDHIADLSGNRVTFVRTNVANTVLLAEMGHNNGQNLRFSYASNLLTQVYTPSTNLSVRFSYSNTGDLTNAVTVVSNREYSTAYAYIAGTHVLTQRVSAAGVVRAWYYDGEKATNSIVGAERWNDTSLAYATNGAPVTTVTYKRGDTNITYSYEFNPLVNKVSAIHGPNTGESANWAGSRYSHDERGNFTQVEDADYRPNVQAWSKQAMKYDAGNRLTNYAYGYLVAPTNQYGFGWNTNLEVLTSITDPEGHRTEWDYTNGLIAVERLYPVTNQPVETHYAYTSNGLLSAVTNANGHWSAYSCDSMGNPTQAVTQSGMTNWMTWDILGHLTEIRLPSHDNDTNEPPNMIPWTISLAPDELGWVRKITYPDSTFEMFDFDAIGNLTNYVDMAGRTNRFTWLPTRNLASASRFLTAGGSNLEAKISRNYDQQLNVLTVRDELDRNVESYQLDLQDRPVSVTNVEGQVMTIAWGLNKMVRSMTRFDGSAVSVAYDYAGCVSQVLVPDATNAYRYYKNNLPMTASNRWGVISNAYDGANRLLTQSQPVPGGTLAYGYYAGGQLSNVVSIAGTNTYSLDTGERLQVLNAETPGRHDSFIYAHDNINGMLTGVTYSNGMGCFYSFDSMDRLTGISWTDGSNRVLRSRSYTYTPAGMISNITYETGEKATYTYDSLDCLTRERHADYYGQVMSDEKYEYDLAGNRTQKAVLDANGDTLVTVNYALPVANRLGSWTVPETNLATRFSVVGSSSDPIGVGIRYGKLWVSNSPAACLTPYVAQSTNFYAFDLTCGMGTQYVHAAIRDVAGNTTYVTNRFYPTCLTNGAYQYSSAGCLTNRQYRGRDYTESLGLTWDGQYQLTTVATNGAVAERYGYDAAGRRIFIVEGGVTNWMVYDGNQVVAEVDGTGSMNKSYVYEGLDRAVSMTTYGATTNTYYFLRDHLGSTLALTDVGGAIVESYRYDAWGRVLGVYNALGCQIEESAIGNRILWQGRDFSFKTGLYYFRARYYDPGAGRWLSKDPTGISGGLNMYVFCANNPVNYVDPFGLCKDEPAIFGIGSLPPGLLPYANPSSPWLDAPASVANTLPFAGNALICAFAGAVNTFGIDWSSPSAPSEAMLMLVMPAASGYRVFGRGGRAWHFGVETAGNLNVAHIGRHVRHGVHAAFGAVAPYYADVHVYIQRTLPFFRIWRP